MTMGIGHAAESAEPAQRQNLTSLITGSSDRSDGAITRLGHYRHDNLKKSWSAEDGRVIEVSEDQPIKSFNSCLAYIFEVRYI